MNLLQRLKPEVLQAMESDMNKYPTLTTELKQSLSKKGFYTELTVSEVLELFRISQSQNYSLGELNDLFDKR